VTACVFNEDEEEVKQELEELNKTIGSRWEVGIWCFCFSKNCMGRDRSYYFPPIDSWSDYLSLSLCVCSTRLTFDSIGRGKR
jgi:hypothetical protein